MNKIQQILNLGADVVNGTAFGIGKVTVVTISTVIGLFEGIFEGAVSGFNIGKNANIKNDVIPKFKETQQLEINTVETQVLMQPQLAMAMEEPVQALPVQATTEDSFVH